MLFRSTNANGSPYATIGFQVSDGALYSASAYTLTLSVAAVNDPPTLTTVATLTGATEDTFKEITYADLAAAANEADVDGDTLSFRIDAVSTGTLQKWDPSNGGSWVAVTAGSTFLASGEKLQWKPAADANGTLNAFTVSAYDGSLASSSPVQVQVSVAAVNDAPVNTVPGAQTVNEDTALAFNSTNGNAITVSDVDGNLATTQLSVSNGTLSVSLGSTGATITPGTNGSNTLTLSGTQTQINAALATLIYQGSANFNEIGRAHV